MRRSSLAVLPLIALLACPLGAAEVDRSTLLDAEASEPWRGVGRVNIAATTRRTLCTGTLIAPDVVLTAAHCLVHPETGEPYPEGNVHFVAGWHKGEMTGHSRAAALALDPDYRPGEARSVEDLAADVGLIRLREPLSAAAAAPFAVEAPPKPGTLVRIVSYRRDRAHALTMQGDCRYEAAEGPVLLLRCPVTSGVSGAPVFAWADGEHRVVAAVVAGNVTAGVRRAIAVRVDETVRKLLETLPESGAAP